MADKEKEGHDMVAMLSIVIVVCMVIALISAIIEHFFGIFGGIAFGVIVLIFLIGMIWLMRSD